MANRYEVAARLAEGEPAVDHIQTYVRACEALGYQQTDLTAHPSQVADWYETERGLDLRLLDGDTVELRAAVNAIDEALWIQRSQVTELAAAWRGSGAQAAARFLQRHCDAAEEVATRLRGAAEHYAALRDEVWQAVDGKVATTVAIDERSAADRSAWLTAAQSVTAGDRSTAEVVVHQRVMPFVDNDIRNDWLAAMSAANASVVASYDTAIHALAATREVRFDIPGDLGPHRQPPDSPAAPQVIPPPSVPLPTAPAAAAAPPPVTETSQPLPIDEATPSGPDAPIGDAAGWSTGAGGLGGLGGMTGGIGGVVGSIVDGISSLLGSLAGGSGGSPDLDDGPVDLDGEHDDLLARDDGPDEAGDVLEPASSDEDVTPEPPTAESPPPATEAVAEPVAPPVAAPVADPAPSTPPPADGSTPCEIAEDQLPQAGE